MFMSVFMVPTNHNHKNDIKEQCLVTTKNPATTTNTSEPQEKPPRIQLRYLKHRLIATIFQAISHFLTALSMPIGVTFFILPYVTSQILGPAATFYLAITSGVVLGVLFIGLSLYKSYKANEDELCNKDELDRLNFITVEGVRLKQKKIRDEKLVQIIDQNNFLKKIIKNWYQNTNPAAKKKIDSRNCAVTRQVCFDKAKVRKPPSKLYTFANVDEYVASLKVNPVKSKTIKRSTQLPSFIKGLSWIYFFFNGMVLGVSLSWGIYGIRLISPYTQTGVLAICTMAITYGLIMVVSETISLYQSYNIKTLQKEINEKRDDQNNDKKKIHRAKHNNGKHRELISDLRRDGNDWQSNLAEGSKAYNKFNTLLFSTGELPERITTKSIKEKLVNEKNNRKTL